jgi:hypothetical protein
MVRKVVSMKSAQFQDAITKVHPQGMTVNPKNQTVKYFNDGKVVISNKDSFLNRTKRKGK